MRRIAIVGAGLAGLASAYYLAERFRVTVFEKKGIGAGASGVSAGLLHPYPGRGKKKAPLADEAMALASDLLNVSERAIGIPVAIRNGVIKVGRLSGWDEGEVREIDKGRFLISSGITVFPDMYLKGLFRACEARGVDLIIDFIHSLEELNSFDHVVLAVGGGIRFFVEAQGLGLAFVKGQILTCVADTPLERSCIESRYKAITPSCSLYHLGGTYEDVVDEEPSLQEAIHLLKPDTTVLECRAGIRVKSIGGSRIPSIISLSPRISVITALGSSGFLYHGYLAKLITQRLLT